MGIGDGGMSMERRKREQLRAHRIRQDELKFEDCIIDSVIYHGGCNSCTSQILNGLNRCNGCQYKGANWKKPDLRTTEKPTREMIAYRTKKRGIKEKFKYRLNGEDITEEFHSKENENENPWDGMDEKVQYLMRHRMLPERMKTKPGVDTSMFSLPEYLAKLVAPYGQDKHVASEEFLLKIITQGINDFNGKVPKPKEKSFCKVK